MHITKPPLISAIVDFCKVDGVNRWQLGSRQIETFYFDYDYDATMNWFFGANIPGNPGPEYVKIEFFYENNIILKSERPGRQTSKIRYY